MANHRDKLEGPLSKRQCEVMWLVAEGLTNEEIGGRLGLSGHTVKYHMTVALARLGTSSRTAGAVKFVLERATLLPPSFVAALRMQSAPSKERASLHVKM